MPNSQQLYYVNTGNGPAGPYTLVAIHTMVRNGQLSSNVQVRLPDGADWIPLPTMEESPFQKVMKWVKDKAVNGFFTDSEVLEVRVSFSGRTRRRNYIMTQLCVLGLNFASCVVIVLMIGLLNVVGIIPALPLLAFILWLLLVSVSSTVRRLHDIGLPGFSPWLLTGIFYFKDGVPGSNQWGANPKGIGGNVYPNPYGGAGMSTASAMPVPPPLALPQVEGGSLSQTSPAPPDGVGVLLDQHPSAMYAQSVAQNPASLTPQLFAVPANVPVRPPLPILSQVGEIQSLPTEPAPSDGAGVPPAQLPLANQTSVAASRQQVVSPPPIETQVAIPQPSLACPTSPGVSATGTKTMYYILTDGAKQGPFEAQHIVQMIVHGQITADTQVWTEGMEQWLPIRQVQLV